MMPLCMVISWVYSVAMMIQHIVAEKEHRLKEVRLCDSVLVASVELLTPACPVLPWLFLNVFIFYNKSGIGMSVSKR